MFQIQYRHGFIVGTRGRYSYYTLKRNVLYSGVSNRMANALDNLRIELGDLL